MAKQKAKKAVKETASSSALGAVSNNKPQFEEKGTQLPLIYKEVEHQIAAIRAMRDVEIEHMLIGLRLLKSYLSEEQLQAPAIQFFEKTLNISVTKNGENGEFELRWNDKEDIVSMSRAPDERDVHASLLRRLSFASLGGFGLASDTGRTSLLGIDDLGLERAFDSQTFVEGFNTPGANSQRMSIGMTPKTVRLPKPGEMLLSVHGSPLGVYKEDDMATIQESDEG